MDRKNIQFNNQIKYVGLAVVSLLSLFLLVLNKPPLIIDIEMVKILPGTFILKIPVNNSVEVIYIKKKIKINRPYYIGVYEVTNDQWNSCFKDGGCARKANIKKGENGNHPVVRINWHDAMAFVRWLSNKTKKTYRLPTEEEWAYAAGLGKDFKGINVNYDYTNINKKTAVPKLTLPIGSHSKNKWGLFDLTGNVWEWTLTCWYSSEFNIKKERTISEISNTDACTTRITQGEHRAHIPDFIYDTYNGGCATLRPAANLGFRVLREDDNEN